MSNNRFLSSVISVFAGNSAMLLLGLVFTPLLVRILNQSSYGTYASVMAVFGVVSIIAKAGLFDSVRKHTAEHVEGSVEQAEVVVIAVLLGVGYGVLATAALLIIVSLTTGFNSPRGRLLLVLTLGIVANNLFSVLRGVLYGRHEEQASERIRVFRQLLFITLGLGLAAAGGGVLGVVLALVLSLFIGSTLYAGYTVRRYDFAGSIRKLNISKARDIASFGGLQAVGGIAAALLYRTDILLVDYFSTTTDVALYKAALTPAEFVWFVPAAIQMVMLQDASRNWAEEAYDQINRNVSNALVYATLSLILFGVGLFGLSREFLSIFFGASYAPSSPALQILLVGTFFFGMARVFIPVLQATGWLWYTETMTVGALILNIALNVFLIPEFGILGAAVATSISYAMILIGGLLIWSRTELSMVDKGTFARLVLTFIGFSVIYLPLTSLMTLGNLGSLLVIPPIGLAVFLTIGRMAGFVTAAHIKSSVGAIRR